MKRVLKRLDAIHERLLKTVSPLDSKTFAQRPAENEWSVGEIIHHLALVEERVIKDLEKAVTGDPRRVSFIKRLLPTSIVSSRLLKVKSPKAVTPMTVSDKDVAIHTFDLAREKLKAFCELHGTERFRSLTFKHPFLGEIDGVATISFVGYHEQRHYKQIREVLKKVGTSR